MRVALETLKPLPFYKCWFLFEENDESTVADLRKSLNREFQLAKKSSHLKLMAGGFEYLPRFKLKNYITNNDLVIVGTNKDSAAAQKEAATATDEQKRFEKEDKETTVEKVKVIKPKKSEKDEKKRVKDEKKRRKEQKQIEKKRKRAEEDEGARVEAKKMREDEAAAGSKRTKKRNARKRAARLHEKQATREQTVEETEEQDQAPTPEPIQRQPEHQMVAPEHLVKKNKNKKANFLKEMGKKKQSHVYFDEGKQNEYAEEYTPEQNDNAYGSAFVTASEADERYTGEKRGIEYPIHSMGEYFYADPPPAADYDSLPAVSFDGPCPAQNDRLAIKMLEMTASYTPEISDWKEVKVLSFDQASGVLTVEFLPGFLLMEHHGKFTLRDNNQLEDEEDEEPVAEPLEDQTKVLTQFDVADMRRL